MPGGWAARPAANPDAAGRRPTRRRQGLAPSVRDTPTPGQRPRHDDAPGQRTLPTSPAARPSLRPRGTPPGKVAAPGRHPRARSARQPGGGPSSPAVPRGGPGARPGLPGYPKGRPGTTGRASMPQAITLVATSPLSPKPTRCPGWRLPLRGSLLPTPIPHPWPGPPRPAACPGLSPGTSPAPDPPNRPAKRISRPLTTVSPPAAGAAARARGPGTAWGRAPPGPRHLGGGPPPRPPKGAPLTARPEKRRGLRRPLAAPKQPGPASAGDRPGGRASADGADPAHHRPQGAAIRCRRPATRAPVCDDPGVAGRRPRRRGLPTIPAMPIAERKPVVGEPGACPAAGTQQDGRGNGPGHLSPRERRRRAVRAGMDRGREVALVHQPQVPVAECRPDTPAIRRQFVRQRPGKRGAHLPGVSRMI